MEEAVCITGSASSAIWFRYQNTNTSTIIDGHLCNVYASQLSSMKLSLMTLLSGPVAVNMAAVKERILRYWQSIVISFSNLLFDLIWFDFFFLYFSGFSLCSSIDWPFKPKPKCKPFQPIYDFNRLNESKCLRIYYYYYYLTLSWMNWLVNYHNLEY